MKKLIFAAWLLASITGNTQAQQGTGLVFLDDDDYKDIPLASAPMMGKLPEQIDLSNWFPTPGNQGSQGSCVGWAVAYGLKSYQEAVERKQRPSSQSQVFSPSFIYNQIKISNCLAGSHIKDALNLLKRSGVPTLQSFPYSEQDCSTQPSAAVTTQAKDFAIADWRRVNTEDDVEVKSQLNAGFPIVIGMLIDDGFNQLGAHQIYYGPRGQERGGHAMVVVGYDDSKNAYKIFNSWGTNWGTQGFGWVSYQAFKNRVKEAYTAQDIVINNPTINTNITDNNQRDIYIPPPITPNALSVSATLGQPLITHNQTVQTPAGFYPGMYIHIPGNIFNGVGSQAQIVLRFYMPNGQPLLANRNEINYRDAHGLVATGTLRMPVTTANSPLGGYLMAIPYYALNFQPTGGMNSYTVNVQATLYINEFEKAKSALSQMIIRY